MFSDKNVTRLAKREPFIPDVVHLCQFVVSQHILHIFGLTKNVESLHQF